MVGARPPSTGGIHQAKADRGADMSSASHPTSMIFQDREEAGRLLADLVEESIPVVPGMLVLGVPRGGVIVAAEVARRLGAQLDVLVTRKIGAPGNPELAIGAVSADGSVEIDAALARATGATDRYLAQEIASQQAEARRRVDLYRSGRPALNQANRTVVLVDDGVATGATTRAALRTVRRGSPSLLVLAVPVGPPDTIAMLQPEADRILCLQTPEPFWSVGAFYRSWPQTSDEEVIHTLATFGGTS